MDYYPGPASLAPGLCPGGVVLHIYAVPTERLLALRLLDVHDPVEAEAEEDFTITYNALTAEEEGLCIVVYDGDTGARDTYGIQPGRLEA